MASTIPPVAKIVSELGLRGKLARVIDLLVERAPGERIASVAMSRVLDLCGCRPSEMYLTTVMAKRYEATVERIRRATARTSARRPRVYMGVRFIEGGLVRARAELSKDFEAILAAEGMPAQVPEESSVRTMSQWHARNAVRLPSDWARRHKHNRAHPADEALHFQATAEMAPAYYHALEECLWRGTVWEEFPAWHREFLELHVTEGIGPLEYARRNKDVSSKKALSALQLHRSRAGLRPRR